MKTRILNLFIALAVWLAAPLLHAQGTTAFTYQGQLRDTGTNANGTYTMIFKLFDASSSGNQIGSSITTNPTLSNGLFSVNLDFGVGAFNGSARWLDITISNGVAQTLSPRVQLLPAPYAQFAAVAATVTNGAIMNAQLATNAVNANNISSGQVVKTLNGLKDAVSLSAGTNVTLTTNGNTLQISAASGGSGGSNSVSLAAGNNVGLFTNSGAVQISSFVPNIQAFHNVTNAIFTVPTNVTKIMVEMWGAGGGGGGSDSSYSYVGGGGGAGGYSWGVLTVTPGTSYLVTAGAGGNGGIAGGANGSTGATSSFGSLMIAYGGSGAVNADGSGNAPQGQGGSATGGSIINLTGGGGITGGQNGGLGGGVWRGGAGQYQGGGLGSGPGSGGGGGSPNPAQSSGSAGNFGLVIVYY
jgi:hypothetical protein